MLHGLVRGPAGEECHRLRDGLNQLLGYARPGDTILADRTSAGADWQAGGDVNTWG
jgi:hypothetical protein